MDTQKRRKVLVVSSDSGAACAYAAIAKSGGWKTLTCDHDEDLVAKVESNQIEAMVFDYSPEAGLTRLRKVRQAGLQLPTIVIATHPANEAEMMELDVKIILPKPSSVERLREVLTALTDAPEPEPSDMKVLFQFLERCDAANRLRASPKPRGD